MGGGFPSSSWGSNDRAIARFQFHLLRQWKLSVRRMRGRGKFFRRLCRLFAGGAFAFRCPRLREATGFWPTSTFGCCFAQTLFARQNFFHLLYEWDSCDILCPSRDFPPQLQNLRHTQRCRGCQTQSLFARSPRSLGVPGPRDQNSRAVPVGGAGRKALDNSTLLC